MSIVAELTIPREGIYGDRVELSSGFVAAGLLAVLSVSACTTQTSSPPAQTSSPPARSAAASSVVIAAVGDIACSPGSPDFNDGKGVGTECRQLYTADAASSINPAAVLTMGDNQYNKGEFANFPKSFQKSWGRFLDIDNPSNNKLFPALGNHEYGDGKDPAYFTAPGYWPSFNGGTVEKPNPTGPAGPTGKGWYSFNVGQWHLIALNSECNEEIFAGECGPDSEQYKWLEADLKSSNATCTLAYWHRPLFTQGRHSGDKRVKPFWDLLTAAKADVVLNGHNHSYDRYDPLSADGQESATGIREFVVGMGGKGFYPLAKKPRTPGAKKSNNDTAGVMKMTLESDRYSWKYIRADFPGNGSFEDAGEANCVS